MERTVTLEEIGERMASDLLREVAHGQDSLRVVLESGEMVVVTSSRETRARLKPLPQLKGFVPNDWKEAVYEIDANGQ
ncbi:MAG: hypothetical protein M3Y28_08500 [Armatimonadota bacterium]|nr:hypothetical protein [Armatimonadota bacterium]